MQQFRNVRMDGSFKSRHWRKVNIIISIIVVYYAEAVQHTKKT